MKNNFKKNKICIYSLGRTNSKRCKNKMQRKFFNFSLSEIIIKKLSLINKYDCFFAGYDNYYKKMCKKYDVRFVKRTLKSTLSEGPNKEIHSFLKNQNYDYFLLINPCLPFLSLSTINKFINFCLKKKTSCSVITTKRNYFFSKKLNPLNFKINIDTLNTKHVESIYEFSNCMYFFNKDYFFKNNFYWNWKKNEYMILDNKIEMHDIDTEDDFEIALSIYPNYKKNIFL